MSMIIPDEYDKLFCRCDGSGASFVDSSTANPKTITANGNATQLPIKFNKSAGFFNGTTDYLDIANSTDFAFGTGAFTIEGFFNTGIDATAQTILDTRAATANTTGLLVNIINSTGNKLCVTTATTARITGTTTLAKNTWYHFMVVGNGGANGARTIILYLDGVQEGSTYTNDYNFTDQTLRIGAIKATAGTYFKGWLKELRISNVARTVAVPTAQYKSDSNTKLLMHFDTPATSPLGPAIYFDGTGDYLSVADSSDFSFTGQFTFSTRINWSSVGATGIVEGSYATNKGLYIQYSSGNLYVYLNSGSLGSFSRSFTPVARVWYEITVTRDSSNDFRLFINGQQQGAVYNKAGTLTQSAYSFGYGNTQYLNGYMREILLSTACLYNTSYTPSQTGFTVDANTKLYIKGDENNGVGGTDSTDIKDSETTPKTVTCKGDTKIKYTEDYRSCIFKDETGKFPYPVGSAKVDFFAIGSGVGYFDGSGDYLSIGDDADWDMGTGDYTFESYFRSISFSAQQTIFEKSYTGAGFFMGIPVGGATLDWRFNGASPLIQKSFTFLTNTWYHISVSRNGTNWRAFVNGNQIGTTESNSNNITGTSGALGIGRDITDANFDMNGLLDNIRISKGVARYTATFNPPVDYPDPVTVSKLNFFALF